MEDRLELIEEVYNILTDEEVDLDSDAYLEAFGLLGAIAKGSTARVDLDGCLAEVLSSSFEESHPIWDYVHLYD